MNFCIQQKKEVVFHLGDSFFWAMLNLPVDFRLHSLLFAGGQGASSEDLPEGVPFPAYSRSQAPSAPINIDF
jgi:hypothetical protein